MYLGGSHYHIFRLVVSFFQTKAINASFIGIARARINPTHTRTLAIALLAGAYDQSNMRPSAMHACLKGAFMRTSRKVPKSKGLCH